MAITKLQLYNIALMALGERTIDSLSESGEPRRLLDEVYDRGKGAITRCLEQGQWNHAMRAVKIDASASVSPSFGFDRAFDKPTDFIRLNQISADENFSFPLEQYEIEGDYIYAWVDPLYLRYVSNASTYGADFSKWPDTFSEYVGYWMATQIAPKLINDVDLRLLREETRRLLIEARSKDASQEPPRRLPLGSWARSRGGGIRGDRGNRGSLIG